ncbi:MAG: hypothetical protein II266_00470 [Clostridia bacterium]|nr:hypothetical protein [Clostridia bacterium]
MNIKINGLPIDVREKETYLDAAKRLGLDAGALAVMVRGETLSLNSVCKEEDAHILTYFDEEGKRVYERSVLSLVTPGNPVCEIWNVGLRRFAARQI